MTRRQKDPLRPLTEDERYWLLRVVRSQSEPAAHVAPAPKPCSPSPTEAATPMRPGLPDAALGRDFPPSPSLQPRGARCPRTSSRWWSPDHLRRR